MRGLSPRVRGNPGAAATVTTTMRSIPACAGEPRRAPLGDQPVRVYPRVCGGTVANYLSDQIVQGLSPRVRGNPAISPPTIAMVGSIPACAGEPNPERQCPTSSRVYPRVCGGTLLPDAPQSDFHGLSPRVRGNPSRPPACLYAFRSIPACAGEPRWSKSPPGCPTVYPRVCGGTRQVLPNLPPYHGLSPRVRGNPPNPGVFASDTRSIPACAGEPAGFAAVAGAVEVYPRVCGGTRQKRFGL